MQGPSGIAHRLGQALGLAALAGVALADTPESSDCLIASMDSLAALSASTGKEPGAPLLALLDDKPETLANLEFVCVGDRLTSLKLRLVPGQTRSLMLVTRPEIAAALRASELASGSGNGQNGAWLISLRPVQAGDDRQPVQLIELVVTADAGNRRGQQESFRLFGNKVLPAEAQDLSLELNLESLDSERMFRDNFKVDPSVGQFSQRGQRPEAPAGRADQGTESASL